MEFEWETIHRFHRINLQTNITFDLEPKKHCMIALIIMLTYGSFHSSQTVSCKYFCGAANHKYLNAYIVHTSIIFADVLFLNIII